MKPDDVYQHWKSERSAIDPPDDLESKVMAQIASDHPRSTANRAPKVPSPRWLDQPAVIAVAVVAASLIGIIRLTLTLFIGITSS